MTTESVDCVSTSPLRSQEKVTAMSASQVRAIGSPNAMVRSVVFTVNSLMMGATQEVRGEKFHKVVPNLSEMF